MLKLYQVVVLVQRCWLCLFWDWGCHNRGEGEGLCWNRKTGEINGGGKGTSWEEKGVVENGTHW